MCVYHDEGRQLIFHIPFQDNYKKELQTLCSTEVIQVDIKLTFKTFLRE